MAGILSGKAEQYIELSHYLPHTEVLGPGKRSALWVHGCCFSCEGCLAAEMNARPGHIMEIGELIGIFSSIPETEGITVSGGEPFLQAGAVAALIGGIREKRDYGAILYTGFRLEELKDRKEKEVEALLSVTDILIDGRYERSKDDSRPFRGSSNQRIILLSDRYKEDYEAYYYGTDKRRIEIGFQQGQVYMAGIPSAKGLELWRELKYKAECRGQVPFNY
ncbi:MAG: radical SAM protein [Lachnospiraceae bacterium]|nr:radical SAM protein [Lachnospiraceae bacterium]